MLGPVYYEEIYHETGEAIKLGALTAFLAASVHIYLLAMCGVIWLVYCILDLLKTKKIYNSVIVMSICLCQLALSGYWVDLMVYLEPEEADWEVMD